ncbi:MAG: M23 family metallopeptidase [Prevotella sp.]|jgi:murein DD-endopeptidase MepM/ murein hydrolase activator NlpD|nr:M23 family metallopeptidase [Prevotella sp.]MCI1282120.1 M23 family metallopeptidase [Prevotella sp.]
MSLKRIVKTLAFAGIFIFAAQQVEAQDLLARQAPIDRRMKKVDTLALQNIIHKENLENPSAQLYDDWTNKFAHRATELPDSFKIDLRHFCMPTPSRVITSNFGSRWGRQHKGIDIKVYIGDTIRAAFSGKVRMVDYEGSGYGKYIVIRHPNGLETIYGHLSKQLVSENQVVRAGEPIGLGGNTGRSTGSHLHFETRLCGVALNPALLFDFRAQDVVADNYLFRKSSYERESGEANRMRGKVGNGGYSREEVSGEIAKNDATPNYGEEKLYHKVASGETLSSIAEKRGVTVDQLCKLNHLSRRSRVHSGQILRYS